jgi:hypothetical protein
MDYFQELLKRAISINTPRLKEFTLRVIKELPESVWKLPSSFYHHLPDERGEWGNAIHSIRVCDTAMILADSLLVYGESLDSLKSATLLHDVGKHGPNGNLKIIQTSYHPFEVAGMIEVLGFDPKDYQDVLLPIEGHMGRWTKHVPTWLPDFLKLQKIGDTSFRVVDNTMLLHLADCIAARMGDIGGYSHA